MIHLTKKEEPGPSLMKSVWLPYFSPPTPQYLWSNCVFLCLSGCPLLTTTGLSGLIQLHDLEELELTNCPGATAELFKYYSQHLPHCMVIE